MKRLISDMLPMVKNKGPQPVNGSINVVRRTPVKDAIDIPTKKRALI